MAATKKTKRKPAKKRVGTSQTKKSMATKKAPSARLKRRRKANTARGYYPNPAPRKAIAARKKTHIVGMVNDDGLFYVHSSLNGEPLAASSDIKQAEKYPTKSAALLIGHALLDAYPKAKVFVTEA